MVRFFLLGPLEVRESGGTLTIGGRSRRALLGALLLRRNSVVSVEELVDALWERPPKTAYASLINHVARLRRVLGAGTIETIAPGYRLRTRTRDVDLDRFLGVVRVARASETEQRCELLREADRLWRGRLLADVMLFGPLGAEVEALDELRLQVVEERVEAELRAGRHLELVPELERLVAQHPHRERLVEQLMVALYRAGRQTEALAAYRSARRRLVEELGLDPGEALKRLERAILAHDLPLSPRIRRDAPLSVLAKAVALAPGTPTDKAEFAYRLGIALLLLGERELAREVLEEAQEQAELVGERAIALRAQLERDLGRLPRGEVTWSEALESAERAAAEFEQLRDDLGSALALRTCGTLRRELGDAAHALRELRRAGMHARRAVGASWPTGLILALEAETLYLGPTPVSDALAPCEEILDSIQWGPPGPIGVYCSLGALHAACGDFDTAREYTRRANIACDEFGLVIMRGWTTIWAANVEELAGDLEKADAMLCEASINLAPIDAPGAKRDVACARARILALLDRGTEALDQISAIPMPIDKALSARIEWFRAHALTSASVGDNKHAHEHAVAAQRALGGTDLLPLQGDTLLDSAQLHAAFGDNQTATAAATQARAAYEKKGHLVGAARANAFALTPA